MLTVITIDFSLPLIYNWLAGAHLAHCRKEVFTISEIITSSTAKVDRLREEGYVIAGIVYFAPDGERLFTLKKGSERSQTLGGR